MVPEPITVTAKRSDESRSSAITFLLPQNRHRPSNDSPPKSEPYFSLSLLQPFSYHLLLSLISLLQTPPPKSYPSAMEDLAIKRCEPCNSKDIRSMIEQSANELLPQVPGWNLSSEGGTMKLHRSWKVKSFTKGLEFFQLLAEVAEAEGHHPDLHLVGWNNVKIDIWTHSVGGLTENDFILAAKINALKLGHLLRNKTTA